MAALRACAVPHVNILPAVGVALNLVAKASGGLCADRHDATAQGPSINNEPEVDGHAVSCFEQSDVAGNHCFGSDLWQTAGLAGRSEEPESSPCGRRQEVAESSQREPQTRRRKPATRRQGGAGNSRASARTACGRVKPHTGPNSAPKTCRSGARRSHDWPDGVTDR